jgi:4-aminobutyrate aminotransferase-like enzyme
MTAITAAIEAGWRKFAEVGRATIGAVAVEQRTSSEQVLAARHRHVARGVATPPLVVVLAEGARVEDADGRSYIDFAGGLGCQNTGHGFPPAVTAIHEQVDRYLHQCVMVAVYEPSVEVCRRLGELSPWPGDEQRSLLVNSGAEAVENAVKIARAATERPGVVVFENAFHGRTLLTMTMTEKEDYKRGFGPFAPEVYRASGPYPYRGIGSDEALASVEALLAEHDVACVVVEPVQGEGGFIPLPDDFPGRLLELCHEHRALLLADEVQSGVGRTGPVWAVEHYGVEPDLLVSGKSLGGGLPLAAVTGPAEIVDAVEPGGLGGVKTRLIGFDRHLEEAAMDLGANEWTTFRKVTLPLIAPAILAGALLSFALSVDDFVITYFNAGSKVTFPLFVWGAARVGPPPQVNVFGTLIFVVAISLMVVNVLWQRRQEVRVRA